MFNPFAERADGVTEDAELVAQANHGDRSALEGLILRHQAWVYNIAIRMVYRTHDAEEVTQEVLVKVITKLSTFKGQSAFRTWLYRIVANHVLNMKERAAELPALTFATLGAAIDRTPELDLPDPATLPVEIPLIIEETKIACTTGMLLCLDRRQRLIFTLGEMLGVTDQVGGDVLEMTADNFRQCLSRARRDLHNFMNNQCGLVNKANPCRCAKKTRGFMQQGQVDPQLLTFVPRHVQRVREVAPAAVRDIEDMVEQQHAAIYRDHPFLEPADQVAWLRRMLDSSAPGASLCPGQRQALHNSLNDVSRTELHHENPLNDAGGETGMRLLPS
jgi:RNA polymerase sigma factor (sigma-70 family)